MATKKIKRFQEGGISDKERGLDASRDDKVGFFERLRMGNIDEEGSEAYRRFGAGRGKAESTPVEDRVATPAPQAPAKLVEMDAMEEANARAPIAVPAGPRAMPSVSRTPAPVKSAPVKSAPVKSVAKPASAKPSAAKSAAKPDDKKFAAAQRRSALRLLDSQKGASDIPKKATGADAIPGQSVKAPAGEKVEKMSDSERNISNLLAGAGVAGGALGALKGKKMLDARKRAKAGAKKRAALKRDVEEGIERNLADEVRNYSPSAAEKAIAAKATRARDLKAGQAKTKFTSESKKPSKKTKKFDDSESNIEFKRGGSVAKASKRADGIATRGKTRCKIR